MYFILSKVLLVFTTPLAWAIVLLVFAAAVRSSKNKQRLLIVSLSLLYFFSIKFTVNTFARMWDIPSYKPSNKTYSAAILLGGFMYEDQEGNGYFNFAADRYYKTLKLYNNGKVTYILFTGGNGSLKPNKFTEAAAVKKELKRSGVPDSLVLLEDKSRNTEENASYSKIILANSGLKPPYLLVTSAFHMRRASLIFKKAGIPFIAYPCQFIGYKRIEFADFIPDTDAMAQWGLYIKEVIGYIVALFR